MNARTRILISLVLFFMASTLVASLWFGQRSAGQSAWSRAPAEVRAVMWPYPRAITDFQLQTQHGEPFGPESFVGRWSFLFFGYMACPDICPSSLYAMRTMRQHYAGRDGTDDLQFIFVSVDPEHDHPDDMAEYLSWFDEAFIGLHGPAEQIERLARLMAVKFVEFVDETGSRSIDHTVSVMIVDPAGRVVGALPPPLEPGRMVEQFELLRDYL